MNEKPENARRNDLHPGLAELDALRTGEADAEVIRHVESCETCRAASRELETLAAELNAAALTPAVEVPAEFDARLLAAARERAAANAPRRRARNILRYSWPGWVAAAASVLAAAGLFALHGATSTRREASLADGSPDAASAPQGTLASRPAAAGATPRPGGMDIDRSGGVDIIDAYLLSRRLNRREEVPRSFDFDRDGRVGEADVKAVAARAVALAGGGI